MPLIERTQRYLLQILQIICIGKKSFGGNSTSTGLHRLHSLTFQHSPFKPLRGHYRETSSASFFQECFTGIAWTLSRLGANTEGIVERIGRGFTNHSRVLQTCLSRHWSCWIPARWLEDMNRLGMIGDLIEFQGRGASLVSQGKHSSKHTHGLHTSTQGQRQVKRGAIM